MEWFGLGGLVGGTVRIAIALIEDVFPGLKDMLDIRVRTSAPSCFIRDEIVSNPLGPHLPHG